MNTNKTELAVIDTAKTALARDIEKFAKRKYDDKTTYNIDDIVNQYHAHKIGVMTTGNVQRSYRIMNGGSSLNLIGKQYVIYSNDTDFFNIEHAIKNHELNVEVVDERKNITDNNVFMKFGDNDKCTLTKNRERYRHNTVICTSKRILNMLLCVYATNANNIMQ